MTTQLDQESAQHLRELERQAWIAGDTFTADLLAAAADAKEAEEKFPDELDAAHAEGRTEGIDEFRAALLPFLDELDELAAGRVTKAEVKSLLDRLTAKVEGFK